MSRWKPEIVFVFLLVCNFLNLSAQESIFGTRALGVNDGLSQNHVTAIAQDKNGFIWLGTAIGLNRYDGYQFRIYRGRFEQGGELSSDAIYDIHVDANGGLWVGSDAGLDYYDAKADKFRPISLINGNNKAHCRVIGSDRDGNIWVVLRRREAPQNELVRWDPKSGQARRYPLPWGLLREPIAIHPMHAQRVVLVAREKEPAVNSRGFAVVFVNPENGKVEDLAVPAASGLALPSEEREVSVAYPGGDSLWIGAHGTEVVQVDLQSGAMRTLQYAPPESGLKREQVLTQLSAGRRGELIIQPTQRGGAQVALADSIFVLRDGQKLGRMRLSPQGGCEVGKGTVIGSYVDRSGVLWQSVSGRGMCLADLESGLLSHIHEKSKGVSLRNNFVRSVWKTPDGLLWVGTLDGLERLDRERQSSRLFQGTAQMPNAFTDGELRSIYVTQDGALWICTRSHGLFRSRNRDGNFENFQRREGQADSLRDNHVAAIVEDLRGRIWVITHSGGLQRFLPETGKFQGVPAASGRFAPGPNELYADLTLDSKGGLWLATEEQGLVYFDPDQQLLSRMDLGLAVQPRILGLSPDRLRGNAVWIGTVENGLLHFDRSTGKLRQMKRSNSALPDDTVFAVECDGNGGLWAGTTRGLALVDSRSLEVKVMGLDQGLQSMEFNSRASFLAHDGEVLVGGVGGLNTFYPRSITQNSLAPQVQITRVQAYDPSRSAGAGLFREVFRFGMDAAENPLSYASRDLIFDFVGLHYANPARNRYRYRLDGFDTEWRDAGTLRQVTYSNLAPGSYTFRVRSISSRGVESQADSHFRFAVDRPYWLNPWFYSALAGLLALGAYLLHRNRLHRYAVSEARMEAEVQTRTRELSEAFGLIEKQAAQLKEVDAVKTRFLTNISHDFRTPLTVSLGAARDLLSGRFGSLPERAAGEVERVIESDKRLLRLVDQLLAIARLETGKLNLAPVWLDVVALTRQTCHELRGAAAKKQIQLLLQPNEIVEAKVDAIWMQEVFLNLLSNALEFSPERGTIQIEIVIDESGQLIWCIQDEGPGVSPEERERIFDRYYQSTHARNETRAGIGVGLSLAKEIVELHGGSIVVGDAPSGGASFRVLVPAGNASEQQAGVRASVLVNRFEATRPAEDVPEEPLGGDKAVVLVAEDDDALRNYLVSLLSEEFQVLESKDGRQALAEILQSTPDLVISDVKMPLLDGIELCRTLRGRKDSNFIPVILLSAKVSLAERMEGIAAGANDYVTKPFESGELLGKVRNTLLIRQTYRQKLAGQILMAEATDELPEPESADTVFLRRFYEKLQQRAADPELTVEVLADELALSRMHLYRRLRDAVGKGPAELLMEYRLEQASRLLRAEQGSVSEIAYATGFKSVSHFSRRFREKFGQSPSDYKERSSAKANGL